MVPPVPPWLTPYAAHIRFLRRRRPREIASRSNSLRPQHFFFGKKKIILLIERFLQIWRESMMLCRIALAEKWEFRKLAKTKTEQKNNNNKKGMRALTVLMRGYIEMLHLISIIDASHPPPDGLDFSMHSSRRHSGTIAKDTYLCQRCLMQYLSSNHTGLDAQQYNPVLSVMRCWKPLQKSPRSLDEWT